MCEQFVFAREMVIDQRLGDARFQRDLECRCRFKTLSGKKTGRRFNDFFLSFHPPPVLR